MAPRSAERELVAEVLLRRSFTATHRILVHGELEAVHGHDFEVVAAFAAGDDEPRLAPALDALLGRLSHTDLAATAGRGEHPSAERVASAIGRALLDAGLPVRRLTVHEAPGCAATWIAGRAARRGI